MLKKIASVLILTSASLTALATGDGDLWVSPVSIVCVEQDRSYGSTWYGRQLVGVPEYQEWRKTEGAPLLACIARRKQPMVPPALCAELFNGSRPSSPPNLDNLYKKYASSIQALSQQLEDCGGE